VQSLFSEVRSLRLVHARFVLWGSEVHDGLEWKYRFRVLNWRRLSSRAEMIEVGNCSRWLDHQHAVVERSFSHPSSCVHPSVCHVVSVKTVELINRSFAEPQTTSVRMFDNIKCVNWPCSDFFSLLVWIATFLHSNKQKQQTTGIRFSTVISFNKTQQHIIKNINTIR